MGVRKILTGLLAVGAASTALLAADVAPAMASCTSASTPACQTSTTLLSAVVGTTGTRVLAALPTTIALSGTSGPVSATVTETAAPGDNPWYVTLQSTALDAPTVTGTTTPSPIPASALTLTPTALPTGVGCLTVTTPCTASLGAAGPLDAAETLFEVSGESTGTAYTGIYTGTGTISLTVPNGQPADTYTGTLTATLVQ